MSKVGDGVDENDWVPDKDDIPDEELQTASRKGKGIADFESNVLGSFWTEVNMNDLMKYDMKEPDPKESGDGHDNTSTVGGVDEPKKTARQRKAKQGNEKNCWRVEKQGFGAESNDPNRSDTLTIYSRDDVRDDATSRTFSIFDASKDVDFEVGMLFSSGAEFREALRDHSIRNGYELVFKKNCSDRVTALCKKGCDFKVTAAKLNRVSTFQIRVLVKEHKCIRSDHTRQLGAKWFCKTFIDVIRDQPKLPNSYFKGEIKRRFHFDVNRWVIYDGRKMAEAQIYGDRAAEFARARDYAHTLMQHDTRSTCFVHVDPIPNPMRPRFERMYVCLAACVSALRNGCRPFLGLDGCFLKGPNGGQLLTAVTRDANTAILPVAWAWVEAENRSSWMWFIQSLVMDIGIDRRWTIMSDRQKGLIDAVAEIMPDAEHRFCVKHIHENMKAKKYTDVEVRKRLWSAASAYTYQRHKWHMDILKVKNINAWKYLLAIDTKTWCRYQFPTASKTDLLVNNAAESFNARILEIRELPLLSLMERIRRMLMVDFEERRKSAADENVQLGKNILLKLRKKMELGRSYEVLYANHGEYEVCLTPQISYKVDINQKTCTCREWELSGLPCSHAMAAFGHARIFSYAPYVDPYYSKEAYKRTYDGTIHALPGRDDWVRTDSLPIDPPVVHKRSGRPKKKRVRSEFEQGITKGVTKLGKSGQLQFCSKCGKPGHNKRVCNEAQDADGEGESSQVAPRRPSASQQSSQLSQIVAPQEKMQDMVVEPKSGKRPIASQPYSIPSQSAELQGVRHVLKDRQVKRKLDASDSQEPATLV